jgi:hypothetical protein
MTKNTSIILVAVLAAIIVAGTLAVTLTTSDAYAHRQSIHQHNGINGGNKGHDPCDNAGPAQRNPHCL